MEFVEEIRLGFFSKYIFKCKICNLQEVIRSEENCNNSYISINKAIENGTIAIGILIIIVLRGRHTGTYSKTENNFY